VLLVKNSKHLQFDFSAPIVELCQEIAQNLMRLSNASSKRWTFLEAAYNLWFAYYNFCWIHKTLKVAPAMESGIANRIWELGELLI
jgi:hypothetical protein